VKLNTNRLKALVDGIFAIIMTIMIVSFSEVLSFVKPDSNADFYILFLSLVDDLIAYALSFLILGILWFGHHWQFHFIKHIDPMLVFINIIWLMFLCLIPFSTMLLGDHYNFFAPVFTFELNIFIVLSILHIHWAYAAHKGRLTELSLDVKTISKYRSVGLSLIIIILLAMVLTFWRF